jgi:hypothetical protein
VLLYVAYSSAGFAVLVGLVWFMHTFVKSALSAPSPSISHTPATTVSSPLKVHPLPQVPSGLEDRSPGVVTLPSGLHVVHPPTPVELKVPSAGPSRSGAVHELDDRI